MQPATAFQEIHILNNDYNSQDEIKNMNNICRDAFGYHLPCIIIGCLVAPLGHQENLPCRCNLETFPGNKIVVIDMYVYMTCRNFLWNAILW